MPPSAPSTDFPGNIFFYGFLIGFAAFFLWSVSVRLRWFASAQWVNRFTQPIERVVGLFPYLLGNSRVVRPRYWYSGLLHTLIGILLYFSARCPTESHRKKELQFATAGFLVDCLLGPLPQQT